MSTGKCRLQFVKLYIFAYINVRHIAQTFIIYSIVTFDNKNLCQHVPRKFFTLKLIEEF